MKKLFAIVMVLAMLCVSGLGAAESTSRTDVAETMQTYALNTLQTLETMYDAMPSQCDEAFILMAHAYYDFYQAVQEVKTAEMEWDLSSGSIKSPLIDMVKTTANGYTVLNGITLEYWKKWTGGEISNEEYLEFLMKQVKVTTSRKE